MKGFGSQSLLIVLGLKVKNVNASTNMSVYNFTNITKSKQNENPNNEQTIPCGCIKWRLVTGFLWPC